MDPVIHAMHMRMGRRHGWEKACYRKVDYKTEGTGVKAAKVLTRKFRAFMETYPCWFCHGWHVRHRLPLVEVLYFSVPDPPLAFTTKTLNCPTCHAAPRTRYWNLPYAHAFEVPQWPGDLYICWECGSVYAVDEDKALVALTEDQLQQLIEEVHDEQRRGHQGSGVCSVGDGTAGTG